MRKRKRLFDKYKKSKSLLDFENYKHVRNKITNEIRKSKKAEVDNLAKKLEDNKWGLRGSKLYRYVFVMYASLNKSHLLIHEKGCTQGSCLESL